MIRFVKQQAISIYFPSSQLFKQLISNIPPSTEDSSYFKESSRTKGEQRSTPRAHSFILNFTRKRRISKWNSTVKGPSIAITSIIKWSAGLAARQATITSTRIRPRQPARKFAGKTPPGARHLGIAHTERRNIKYFTVSKWLQRPALRVLRSRRAPGRMLHWTGENSAGWKRAKRNGVEVPLSRAQLPLAITQTRPKMAHTSNTMEIV